MNSHGPARVPLVPWLHAAAWTLLIYCTIPLARRIQAWVSDHWTRDVFLWLVYASVAVGAAWAALHLRRGPWAATRRQWILLLVLAAAFAGGAWWLRGNPEEALHLVQYGVLSLLLFRAFSRHSADRGALAASFLLCAILGMVDEVIQWAVPQRLFDYRDAAINAGAGLLMQLGLAAGLAPGVAVRAASWRTAKTSWLLACLFVCLYGFCLSNTSEVWRPFRGLGADFFAFDESMTEYGYLHVDPMVGSFKSRLTLDQLRAEDARRAQEVAAILDQHGSDSRYADFLRRYPTLLDPFVHELRVHLYRRDRYWQDAQKGSLEPQRRAEFLLVAWAENGLLENWFGSSLVASDRDWSAERRAKVEAHAQPGRYVSPVGRKIITWCSRGQMQAALGGLLLVTLLAAAYDLRRRRQASGGQPTGAP